jgi:hypothetical protein
MSESLSETCPVVASALTSAIQPLEDDPGGKVLKGIQQMLVSDNAVVLTMTPVFAFQGHHQLFHRKISGFAQPFFQSSQSTTKAISCRLRPDLRSIFGVFPPTIREAEKIELFAADKEPVEAKTASFLRGQRKLKLSEPPFQRLLKLSGLIMILKSTNKVINIADNFCTPPALWLYLMLEP